MISQKFLYRAMKIKRYTMIDNLFSLVVAGLIGEFILITYLLTMLDNRTNDEYILPVIEPIVYEESNEIRAIYTVASEYTTTATEVLTEGLNAHDGIYYGSSGKETWYNLPMHNVIDEMRRLGYSELDYPYYIREDGVKMLGDFVIVAADLNRHPRGSVVNTSLGQGLVCDTGDFINTDVAFDIAVDW